MITNVFRVLASSPVMAQLYTATGVQMDSVETSVLARRLVNRVRRGHSEILATANGAQKEKTLLLVGQRIAWQTIPNVLPISFGTFLVPANAAQSRNITVKS